MPILPTVRPFIKILSGKRNDIIIYKLGISSTFGINSIIAPLWWKTAVNYSTTNHVHCRMGISL